MGVRDWIRWHQDSSVAERVDIRLGERERERETERKSIVLVDGTFGGVLAHDVDRPVSGCRPSFPRPPAFVAPHLSVILLALRGSSLVQWPPFETFVAVILF